MNLHTLRIFVVSKQWLQMFPAVQGANLSKLGINNDFERFGLSFTPDRSLHVGWLDLSSMMDDFAICIDE
jgi:hypothetical protein